MLLILTLTLSGPPYSQPLLNPKYLIKYHDFATFFFSLFSIYKATTTDESNKLNDDFQAHLLQKVEDHWIVSQDCRPKRLGGTNQL